MKKKVMKNFKYLVIIASVVSALISCDNKGEFDSYPPAVNKTEFQISTSQTGKDTLFVKDNKDFKLHHIILVNKSDNKGICEVNALYEKQTKFEINGTTYGEVEYSNGEASLIKIYNWGTIERISTTAHKKAYAITYNGKKPADIEVNLIVLGERGGIGIMLK
jgi:lipoprotein